MVVTSPLLTLWSTTVLRINDKTDPNQVISLLAGQVVGWQLEIDVALPAALLLFASRTAIIGSSTDRRGLPRARRGALAACRAWIGR